jgi:quercetin dioxygenase-like cupin family protein
MAKVSIVRPGEGEILESGPARIRVLENGEHTEHRLGFAEITIPPGFPSPLQHRHAQHDEGFYVLKGTLRFTIGEDDYDAGPGTWVIVPTGAPHTFANPGDETAVMLNTFTPDLYIQYFRDFKALIDSGRPVNAETMSPLWKNYATEISSEYASS